MPLKSREFKQDSNTQVSFSNPNTVIIQGNAGGLTLKGGSASGDDLTLESTSNATKGSIFLGSGGLHLFDDVNKRLGLGIAAPVCSLDVDGATASFTDFLSLPRFTIIRASRTETSSLTGSNSDGQMHLELKLNPSSSYAGLATNTATFFMLTESGNAQNFTTVALRASNVIAGHQGTGTVTNIQAIGAGSRNTSTGTVTTLTGLALSNLNNAGGTVTENRALLISQPVGRTSGSPNSVWTAIYGINISDQNPTGASNTLTNAPIALRIGAQTASGAYSIQSAGGLNYFAGNTRIGAATAPTNALSVTGTTDVSTQVTTPIVSGGTGSSDTLTLKSNDTAWPRTARIQTDFLTIGQNFTYPTGSAAAFNSVNSSPAITGIDVASANLSTFQVTPSWTYTVAQSWGLAPKAGLNFVPSLISAVGAGGTDNVIFYGINGQPQVDGSSGSRIYTNVYGIVGDPRMIGTSGTVTNMIGVRSRGSTISGTTATTYTAFVSDYSNPSGATTTTYRGLHIAPSLLGTTTTFEGVKINAQTTPSGNNIGFYQLGTAMHNRFQGKTNIGSDASPTAYLHLAAGTATANTAPLKLTSGTNLTAAEAGAIEYDGNRYYVTSLGTATRQEVTTTMLKQVTLTTTNTSTAETTHYTTTIPGGTLGTSRRIKMTIKGDARNASGTSETLTFKVKFGGTTIFTSVVTVGSSANYRTIDGEFTIQARNSASVQDTTGHLMVSAAGAGITTGTANLLAANEVANYFGLTVASASDQTLAYTIQMSKSDANFQTQTYSVLLEYL